MDSKASLQPSFYYHIYNRGNNHENLFIHNHDYQRFLTLYSQHINPIARTLAYCLMPNHFHILLQIKNETNEQREPSRCFSNLFNAYSRGFNLQHKRSGVLFQRSFRRIVVENERHLFALIVYIHRNPQNHGFVEDFRRWKYSSFVSYVSDNPYYIDRTSGISLFGGTETFLDAHTDPSSQTLDASYTLETMS